MTPTPPDGEPGRASRGPSVRGGTASLALALALGLLWSAGAPAGGAAQSGGGRPEIPAGGLPELSRSFADLAARVSPAVVQVIATGLGVSDRDAEGVATRITTQRTSGSGVILDPAGYVITNAHVVHSARRIRVVLPRLAAGGHPGQSVLKPVGETLDARLVGLDRETDLAVLQLPVDSLPHLELGDSEALELGELVFAFGSPLGLENSASSGVVSSVARQLRPEDPMIYVQTDAAINPGNSGGPLVDARGRVVGINTFILSRSGGSEGVGFAAPSNIVRHVYREILAHGRVRRGVIGVHAQTVDPILARGLDLPRAWGVVLADVYPGGPAERAGLRRGDMVLSLNGKPMENGRQLDVNIYPYGPGDTVSLEVLRRSEIRTVRVPVVRRPGTAERIANLVRPDRNLVPSLGLLGLEVDDALRSILPPLREDSGVLVAAMAEGGMDEVTGLQPGDVIHAVNRVPVTNLVELRVSLGRLRAGDAVVMEAERDGRLLYLGFEMPR